VVILTFSDKEEHVIEKIMAALAEDLVYQSAEISTKEDLNFGDLKISPSQRIVLVNGVEIPLTTREFDVLYLARPAVKSCVSVFRQSQDWLVENGAVSGLNSLPPPFPRVRDGMRAVCGVNAAPGVGKP